MRIQAWLSLTLALACVPGACSEPQSDRQAAATIIGDDHLANVLELRRETLLAAPERKYAMLRDSVFPPDRDLIRTDYEFAPSYVNPQIAPKYGLSDPWSRWRLSNDPHRHVSGGELVSPVIDLTKAASAVGKLDEVERILEQHAPGADELKTLAVRLQIALARNDLELARRHLQDFDQMVSQRPIGAGDLSPATIVMWTAAVTPGLEEPASDLAFRFYQYVSTGEAIGSELWRRQLFAMFYLLQWRRQLAESELDEQSQPAQHWHPVTRMSADTNGAGYPIPLWDAKTRKISSVTGHDKDYVYFDTPLTGNFSVEAMLSPFGFGDTRLGFGGVWAGPGYDHKALLVGHFNADDPTEVIDPPLDSISESMRVRLDVQDGIRTTSINGREVFRNEVSTDDPWLSIFSFWYTNGWTTNLRITGDVEIPDSIQLATRADLLGWNAYFGESIGGENGHWKLVEASRFGEQASNTGQILHAGISHVVRGSLQESLLQYHRPILEDANISYEFYYREGECVVHPAIDRCALLITPSEVRKHWIGNGRFERLGLRPDNVETDGGHNMSRPPLRNDAWNRVEMKVRGDAVRVYLNEEAVFQTELDPSNLRVLGFFRYADQSEVRIRNIHWQGDWRKALPPAPQQELADDTVETLLSKEFSQSFSHDFTTGIPADKFARWGQTIQPIDDGVRVINIGKGNYAQTVISPQIEVAGDFDATVEFHSFEGETSVGDDTNVHLMVQFPEHDTTCVIYRKFTRFEKPEGHQIIQAAHFYSREDRKFYDFPFLASEASTFGKLKLARHGDQLHYLYAAEDSTNFRLMHTETVPTGMTKVGGLRLISETTKSGKSDVIWKSIVIRADQITGPAARPGLSLAELDAAREKLSDQLVFDFSDPATARSFGTWGTDSKFDWTDEGLLVTAPGFDRWRGHFVVPRAGMVGNFDVTLDLDVRKLQNADPGGESVVLIQAEVPDEDRTYVETKFAISETGETAGEIQLRQSNGNGGYTYTEVARIPIESASRLRLARNGDLAYFILQRDPESKPMMMGRLELAPLPIVPGALRILVHTSGEGHETIVLLKKLTLQAEQIQQQTR